MDIAPCTLKAANAFVKEHHRHHPMARGCVFCLAVKDGGKTVGVAIVGRPVSRHLQDGYTAEVTRVATDGTRNACSMLLSRCRRAAQALGYRRLITYTLEGEDGASLRASGFNDEGLTRAQSWTRATRPRNGSAPTCRKRRWSA